MILAVDVGNTTVHFCLAEREGRDLQILQSRKYPTESQSFPFFSETGVRPDSLEGSVICSVVPDKKAIIEQYLREQTGKQPVMVSSRCESGFSWQVKEPDRVGADRIADACGALKRYALPLVSVDVGTCVTFNVLNRERQFLGGAIAPGPHTSMDSLGSKASQLFPAELTAPESSIGKNTAACLQSGVVLGTASMIDGMLDRFAEELGESPTVVVTGGGAPIVEPSLKTPHFTDPELLIYGSLCLYDWNS